MKYDAGWLSEPSEHDNPWQEYILGWFTWAFSQTGKAKSIHAVFNDLSGSMTVYYPFEASPTAHTAWKFRYNKEDREAFRRALELSQGSDGQEE